jgi:hypothetical protein
MSENQLARAEVAEQRVHDLELQIDALANYILSEVPGEPSQSEGAVDTAIRVMREQRTQLDNVRRRLLHVQGIIEGVLNSNQLPTAPVFTGIDFATDAITELDVVFAPEPDASHLVFAECEVDGTGMSAGRWIDRADGMRALRLRVVPGEVR